MNSAIRVNRLTVEVIFVAAAINLFQIEHTYESTPNFQKSKETFQATRMRDTRQYERVLRRRAKEQQSDLLDDIAAVCARYGQPVVLTGPDETVSLADNVGTGAWPLNGLRHRPGSTSGWFLWAGEETSDDPDFFKPHHVRHLTERCPEAMPYLGLPPGYRFLIAPGHEDVWADATLLDHTV